MIDRIKQIGSAYNLLNQSCAAVANIALRKMCYGILIDEQFRICTASRKRHQAYDHGLMVHTAEVMEIATNIAKSKCFKVDMDVIITAIMFHDFAKIYDYKKLEDGSFDYTEHQSLIRHLAHSYAYFLTTAEKVGFKHDNPQILAIAHCILAHHGRKEWGSPVEPITPEAQIIHVADELSAGFTLNHWE